MHDVLAINLHFVDNGTSIAVTFLLPAVYCQERNVLHFKYAAAADGVNTVYLSIKMTVVLFFSLLWSWIMTILVMHVGHW